MEILQDYCPDLILLDLSMPDRDGLAVLAELKAWPARSGVPVVIYSAVTDEGTKRAVLKLGASDFVEKGGIPWKELAARIDRQLACARPGLKNIVNIVPSCSASRSPIS